MNFHLLLVDFPCWAAYLKYTSETVEIQNALQNLRYSTRICLPWQMTQFQFQSRTDQCLRILYVGFFYELTGFEPLDVAPGHVRVAFGNRKAGLITRLILW